MKNIAKKTLLMLFSISLIGFLMGCGMEEIKSSWYEGSSTNEDTKFNPVWRTDPHLIVKDEVAVNVMNNNDMLFLRFTTHDCVIQRQILISGLTIWLDGEGNKRKIFGIHYPTGATVSHFKQPLHGHHDGDEPPGDIMDQQSEDFLQDIEIFGPERYEHTRMVSSDKSIHGIRCHITSTKNYFVYELAVPLTRTDASNYGIALNKPKVICLGLETGKDEKKQRFDIGIGGSPDPRGDGEVGPGGGPGGKPGGGPGGGPGGKPGGGPGGGPQGGPDDEPGSGDAPSVNQWLKIYLAPKP